MTAGMSAIARGDAPASAPATQPTTQAAPATTAVKRGSLSITVDAQGAFEPVDAFEVRIRPKAYSGEMLINAIAANGATVKKGDVLLEIDQAAIKRMVAASENDLRNARASEAKSQADAKIAEDAEATTLRQQQTSLKEAEDSLKWFETMDGPQYLKTVELTVQQYDDQVRDAGDELEQLKKMYKSEELTNATADVVVRQAVRKLEIAKQLQGMMKERATKAREFTYPMLHQHFKDAADLTRQQVALFQTALAQQKITRQTGLAASKAAVAAAELRDSELKADLEKLTVRAPEDGVVYYGQIVSGNWQGGDPKTLRVGERATPQSVIMTLCVPGKLRLVVDLAESRYFAVQSGQKASISPVAYPELKYEGLCEPDQRTSGGGNYPLHIATGQLDSRVLPGMKAAIHMEVPLVDNALLVPTTAVSNSTVWLKGAEGAEESRTVLTGRTDGKSIEILSGLKEGDEILTHAKQ
jgi:HlyD family secretion protein